MITIMKKFYLLLSFLLFLTGYTSAIHSHLTSVDFETRVEFPSVVDPPVDGPEDVQEAGSEIVTVAEPNIAALLGISTLAGTPGLLAGIRNQGFLSGGRPSAQTTPDLTNLCGSNSDALTNLLVYQYLSGSIPGGANGLPNKPNDVVPSEAAKALNPPIEVLRNKETPGKTSTSVSTTITTRVITMEASTNYMTSTTSYITTVTQITSSVLPIIFRGSKLITTITDRTTEVLTATEFKTISSVIIPSIVQTLPVEITLLHKSTIGSNGKYTLDVISAGATKVIEKPLSTSQVNFDNGLSLSSLDLSNVDLSSLTALIDQYSDQDTERDRDRQRNRPKPKRKEDDRRFRFRDRRPQRKSQPVVEEPKFNVLSGFTYIDRPATSKRKSSTGTASLSTRYSKFRKKNPLKNNNVSPLESDRESEPYSATTSRRTFYPAKLNRPSRHSLPRNRFFDNTSDGDLDRQASSLSGIRRNGESDTPVRRTGRNIDGDKSVYQNNNHIKRHGRYKGSYAVKTTVLTMYMTGPKPGQTVSLERTVTLRNISPHRSKRNAPLIQPTKILEKLKTTHGIQDPLKISPEKVISLLKGLDRSKVNEMLSSLHKWVDFYIENVIDEPEKSNLLSSNHISTEKDAFTELISSYHSEQTFSDLDATKTLPILPRTISETPSKNVTQFNHCQSPVTLTETVFKTVYIRN